MKLTSEMVDALVTALGNSNAEEIKKRYELIHKVPVYEENVELLQKKLLDLEKLEGDVDFSKFLSPSPVRPGFEATDNDSPRSATSNRYSSIHYLL